MASETRAVRERERVIRPSTAGSPAITAGMSATALAELHRASMAISVPAVPATDAEEVRSGPRVTARTMMPRRAGPIADYTAVPPARYPITPMTSKSFP